MKKTYEFEDDAEKVLFSEETIKERLRALAEQIEKDYKGKIPLMICVLKGSVLFFTDLIRQISLPVEIDFMSISSYGSGATTSGEVKVLKDLDNRLDGRDVIIVEDIVDSGLTLNYMTKLLSSRNPASIKVCSLLDKPSRRKVDIKADYTGFVVGNEFVIGYGLDYAQKYRNLPYIGILKRKIYEK